MELAQSYEAYFARYSLQRRMKRLGGEPNCGLLVRCREAFEVLHTLTVVEQVSWSDMLEALKSKRDDWSRSPVPRADRDSKFAAIGSTLIKIYLSYMKLDDVKLTELYFEFDERKMSLKFRSAMEEI